MARPLSLTGLGRTAQVLVLAALLLGGGWAAGLDPRQLRSSAASEGGGSAGGASQTIGRRLITYRLDPVRVTEFRFTQPVTQARLVTQPVLAPGSTRAGLGWTYSIKAELLDTAGAIIATRLVSSRALLLDPAGLPIGPRRFYRGSRDEVALGDEVRIASAVPFASLRLTSLPSDPGVRFVDVRVSERRPLIASAAETAFIRFSPDDQTRLAAANAFPPAMLTAAERTNIAINQWRPVGPIGIEGRDHVMGVLYEEAVPGGITDELETAEETGE